jgi:hypothetical protein
MADLVERLMGIHPTRPQIPVHQFEAIFSFWADGTITPQQAQAGIEQISGATLLQSEIDEAAALRTSLLNSSPVRAAPTGTVNAAFANTQALRAQDQAQRNRLLHRFGQVLLAAEQQLPGFDTATAVRAKLGI